MEGEWYDPAKMKGTGIYDFVEKLGTLLTSEQARASTDGEQFRREAWAESLDEVTDAALRQVLEATGPFGMKSDLKGVIEHVLEGCGSAVHDLPHIMIALSLSHMGINPRFLHSMIPADWRK